MDFDSTVFNFTFVKKLGSGSFSQVFQVKRPNDSTIYAMKRVKIGRISEREKQNALNEIRILASFNHPNIIQYYDSIYDQFSETLNIIMEYANGGDISNQIKSNLAASTHISEQQIWHWIYQILKGLKQLHDSRIIHRDIKSANIFIQNNIAKLGDMNVSKIIKQGLVYTQTGTPYYASPEIWKDQPYNFKSDIWSLGCVIYEIAALHPPFMAKDMQSLSQKITKGKFARIPSIYSEELQYFIQMCLTVNPVLRPNCDQLLSTHILKNKIKQDCKENIQNNLSADYGLIETIRMPKNLKLLNSRLPKPQYLKQSRDLSLNLSTNDSDYKIDSGSEKENIKPLFLPKIVKRTSLSYRIKSAIQK